MSNSRIIYMMVLHTTGVMSATKIIIAAVVIITVWKNVIFWMTTPANTPTSLRMFVALMTTMLTIYLETIDHRCVNKITLKLFDISSIVRTWTTK